MTLRSVTNEDCRLVDFQVLADTRGSLSVAETQRHVPFGIERMFIVSGVDVGTARGGHAHKRQRQMLICTSGAIEVRADNGSETMTVVLDTPAQGLYIPPMIWAEQTYLSEGSVLTVLCDDHYDEDDYLRDRDGFARYLTEVLKGKTET
jgi:dTDP-4-dehydrorhamnose 3,5-epimerase-like enzyme